MGFDSSPQLFYQHSMTLLLASKSPYRKALLEQVGFYFEVQTSPFDEDSFKKESALGLKPEELCLELAKGKAQALSFTDRFVIGSDQLIELDGRVIDKPGSFEKALEQLSLLSGRTHQVHTSLALISHQGELYTALRTTSVRLRTLSRENIERYLKLDQPYDCAGSYKMERGGLMLAEHVEGGDPSAIQGLSLIDLFSGLRHFGMKPTDFWKENL